MAGHRVGFVGLGIMGRPMARNLMRAGHELVVHSRSRGPVDELVAEGAEAADSPHAVAERCWATITMLPDSPDVREAMLGETGALAGSARGDLLIDMSTISPQVARDVAAAAGKRGVGAVDAPVSAGDQGAIDGVLSIMAGGAGADVERARPLFEAMGTPTHVGEAGTGQVTKSCNQIVVAGVIQAVSEALVLGSKAGVDPERLVTALSGGLAGTKVMEAKRAALLEHDPNPGFKTALHSKDLAIVLETAREHGVSIPASALLDQLLRSLATRGRGDEDHAFALLSLVEEAACHRVGETPSGASSP